MKTLVIPALAAVIAATTPLAAADPIVLDVSKDTVEKFSTSESMIGTRNTLLFYTFKDRRAVLQVTIDNQNTKFPITATIHKFADGTTAESLAKWINNQHSDGLFPEIPEPVESYPIPEDSWSVISHELINRTKHRNGEHDNYSVRFKIDDFSKDGVLSLKGFEGEAKVHVKVNG